MGEEKVDTGAFFPTQLQEILVNQTGIDLNCIFNSQCDKLLPLKCAYYT